MSNINKALILEQELLESGYRKYSGDTMDIFYNKNLCEHAAKCVNGNPEVFDTSRRPWIMTDNGSNEENEAVLNLCPTGALKYILKED